MEARIEEVSASDLLEGKKMYEKPNKLNREQIIKALECCTSGINHKGDIPCLDCPYDECNIVGGTSERQITGTCQSWLKKDALSLIKELTEENERLRESTDNELRYTKELVETLHKVHEEKVQKAKADTVQKMQERLMECFNNEVEHLAMYTEAQVIFAIDQIAKEMLEGEK